jgi:hypothetical protein
MEKCKRFRNRWTIKECLKLQREFELLKLSIDDIALKHQRTPNAIMLKLDEQELADYNVLYNNYHGLNSPMEVIRKHTHDEFDEENIINNFIDETEDDDDEEYIEDEETISDEDEELEEDDDYNLHNRINQLEKHVSTLTELVLKLKQNTNKSVFSLFG